jgi:signal recognition particle subunit SRP54
MFDNLTRRLTDTVQGLRGRGRLTDESVAEALREVRIALLEADVALPVVKEFIGQVRERALGREVLRSLTPGQALVKVVHEELVRVMGEENESLDLSVAPPAVVLVAGLQGSGKTTTCAKLARYLIDERKKKVMLVSCDVYRPAAIDQLRTLSREVGAEFVPSSAAEQPVEIARGAVSAARRKFMDVLIVDSAGRLHIDERMMEEIRAVHTAVAPHETLFVVDSMTGQDAANTARAFDEALALTGVILTKTDGDARGGAALSVRRITGKPIKFMGTGEKTDALQPFHPDRIASRILGMGDVLSLVEEVQRTVDQEQAERLARKIRRGRGFNLEDFRSQLEQMQTLGGVGGLADKLPGMDTLPDAVRSRVDDRVTRRMIAIINSMTPQERRFPDVIRGSRKKRIAHGSGTSIQDVNRVLKQFGQMQRMMKKFGKGGVAKMMRQMGRLQGQRPPGGFGR